MFFLFCGDVNASENITINVTQTINSTIQHQIGINTNFLMDDDAMRTPHRSTAAALEDMGVKYLRYPGGEKSDGYLWAVPPFNQSVPTLARTGTCEWPSGDATFMESDGKTFKINPFDFDEFMAIARSTGAQANLVVAYDSMYKPSSCNGMTPTREQLLQTATEWVRYANITKGYGVKYWEIGNESNQDHYNGTATAADYANDLKIFSQAMKAVDPSIKIGANGLKSGWWQTILSQSASVIDFLVVHEYPPWQWGSYEYYRTHTPDLTPNTNVAINAINTYAPEADRGRLKIAITEFNAHDWSGLGWENVNNTGHALILFEMIGEYLKKPQVEFLELWNTRWVNNNDPNIHNLGDALDRFNEFTPTGRIMYIWGNFLKDKLVQTTSTPFVRSFATVSSLNNTITILLLNKNTSSQEISVMLQNFAGSGVGAVWVFKGSSPEDLAPTWTAKGNVELMQNSLTTILNPLSVTVLAIGQNVQPSSSPSPSTLPSPSLAPSSSPSPSPHAACLWDTDNNKIIDGEDLKQALIKWRDSLSLQPLTLLDVALIIAGWGSNCP